MGRLCHMLPGKGATLRNLYLTSPWKQDVIIMSKHERIGNINKKLLKVNIRRECVFDILVQINVTVDTLLNQESYVSSCSLKS